MSQYFSYLNFPKIPDEFIPSILDQKNLAYSEKYYATNEKEVYGSRVAHVPISVELWIKRHIFRKLKPKNLTANHIMIHVSEYIEYNATHNLWDYDTERRRTKSVGIVPMHKDWSRWYPVNYVIDTGGTNVVTSWYDDKKKLLESHTIEPFRWHVLAGKVYHGVQGIKPGRERILISINWDPDNPESFSIDENMKDYISV